MQTRVLKVDSRDNVLIALTDLNQGEHIQIEFESYTLVSNVPVKHKFATEDLSVGDDVVMYGVLVGAAVKPIQRGERLTTSNVQHHASAFHEQSSEFHWTSPTFLVGKSARSWVITGPTGRWVQEITGSWFRWCFVKTGTLAF